MAPAAATVAPDLSSVWRLGSMTDHPNAELFKRGYAAFQQGDLDTVRELFDSNIVWHVPGHNHTSGDYVGVDKVLTLFGSNFQETNGTLKLGRHDVIASDSHAVAIATVSGEKDGRTLSERYTHVVRMSNGKV